jgi:hypothetical protein
MCIRDRLKSMKTDEVFGPILTRGKKTSESYLQRKARLAANRAAKKTSSSLLKKGVKKAAKAIPVVGTVLGIVFWADDVKAKGLVYGTSNSAVDAIPYVGAAKGVTEIIAGSDFIPDEGDKGLLMKAKDFIEDAVTRSFLRWFVDY